MMGSSSSAGEAPRRLSDVLEEDRGYSLSDLYRVLRARLGLLIAVPLLAGVLGYGVAWMMPPTFTATTTFLPPQQQQSSASAALASLGALAGHAAMSERSLPAGPSSDRPSGAPARVASGMLSCGKPDSPAMHSDSVERLR